MYLLLRNNKQSGPYSAEELKSMGLKAYDLVWLEGKSAAWRYPSEIDELKAFAPAVEEQPFDRFYKRATQTATSGANGANGAAITVKPVTEAAPLSGESSAITGKRTIYVNLPAGRQVVAPIRDTPARDILTSREAERPRAPVPDTAPPASTRSIGDYSSRPERDEPTSVEFAPRRRLRKNDRLFRILAVGVCILALLAAGIFIGLSLNKGPQGLQQRIASKTTSSQTNHPITPAQQLSVPVVNSSGNPSTTEKSTDPARSAFGDGTSPLDQSRSPVSKTSRAKKQKEKAAETTGLAIVPALTKDSAVDIPVLQREAVHRTDERVSAADNNNKEAARTAIASQVSVGANGYSVGTFGGINDLQLTVTNRSGYPLDLVVVEVQYIQANKKVYKTENLYFRGIGPGAALMQEAPKSTRGIRVQYKITSISSKELGLSYTGI
jgi:hypothetical protein